MKIQFFISALLGAMFMMACEVSERGQTQAEKDDVILKEYFAAHQINDVQKTASGLYYQVVEEGEGSVFAEGDTAVVHYTGWALYGKTFDSSVYRGEPFEFVVGKNAVIQGWEEGIKLMKLQQTNRFYIPSGLAYGSSARSAVLPPYSILVFDIKALERR
jgi:peptidylprolyl isomerase